jgi:hypothetical protein
VIVSPHCADSTPESPQRSLDIFLDNLGRFRRGEPLLNVVDRQAGYSVAPATPPALLAPRAGSGLDRRHEGLNRSL